jgi:hypothetical protein
MKEMTRSRNLILLGSAKETDLAAMSHRKPRKMTKVEKSWPLSGCHGTRSRAMRLRAACQSYVNVREPLALGMG